MCQITLTTWCMKVIIEALVSNINDKTIQFLLTPFLNHSLQVNWISLWYKATPKQGDVVAEETISVHCNATFLW